MKLQADIPIHFLDGEDKPSVCRSSDVMAEYGLKQHATGFMQFSSRERRKSLDASICIQYAAYEDELFLIAKEVFYNNNFPTLIVPSPPGKTQEFYLQKATRWEYEKEWRIVLPLNNCSVVLRPAAIAGVIFGAKVKQETIDVVTMLLDERKKLNKVNVALYQAHLSKTSYDIGIFKHGRTPPGKWEDK